MFDSERASGIVAKRSPTFGAAGHRLVANGVVILGDRRMTKAVAVSVAGGSYARRARRQRSVLQVTMLKD